MKYIKEDTFYDRKNESIEVDIEGEKKVWTIGRMIYTLANSWVAGIKGLELNIGEIRKLQKCLDVLEDDLENETTEYFEFKEDEYETLKKVVLGIAVQVPFFSKHSPQIEDILTKTVNDIPKDEEPEGTEEE